MDLIRNIVRTPTYSEALVAERAEETPKPASNPRAEDVEPPTTQSGPSAARATAAEGAPATEFDSLFGNMENILDVVAMLLGRMGMKSREVTEMVTDLAAVAGKMAGKEQIAQGIENVKAGKEQLKSAKQSGFLKLLMTILAVIVTIVAAAITVFTCGAATPLGVAASALMWGAVAGGLVFGAGAATDAICQGVSAQTSAKMTHAAAQHEALLSDFMALVAKKKQEAERSTNDIELINEMIAAMGELIGELRELGQHNGF